MRVVKMPENEEQPSKQQSNALFLFQFLIFFAGGGVLGQGPEKGGCVEGYACI